MAEIDNLNKEIIAEIDNIVNKKKADEYIKQIEFYKEFQGRKENDINNIVTSDSSPLTLVNTVRLNSTYGATNTE